MISIRSQAAAFRRNSPESENSDQGENQTISSQNSFSDENSGSNLTSEGENQSSQDLLPQNFSSLTSVIRQTRSNFEDTDMSAVSSYLAKVREIDSLNESSDWSE
jgi:hypothetical protein